MKRFFSPPLLMFIGVLIVVLLTIVIIVYFIDYKSLSRPLPQAAEPTSPPELPGSVKNPTINNSKADFNGGNYGEFIHVTWSPASDASEFVLFKSLSLDGPFVEDFRLPASAGTEGVDVTPDARLKTLCYRLEAQDAQGRVVRDYEPVCVPKYVE